MKTAITIPLAAVAISLAAAGCGTSHTPSADAATSTTATVPDGVERPSGVVDQLVSIDSGRMHIRCAGRGDTTVLLIAGWDEDGANWSAIEPSLVETTRVCSYARFGTGRSDPPSATQTFVTQASDLHDLLEAAGEPGPYVVVGHSFGGAEAVTFASQYSDDVTGLMLIDTSPVTWPATACSVDAWQPLCAVFHDPALDRERLDVFPAFDAVASIESLGDVPMTVMTAANRTDPNLAPAELARLDAAWAEGAERWASLSTGSTVVTVADTSHHIQLDQPDRVLDAIVELLP